MVFEAEGANWSGKSVWKCRICARDGIFVGMVPTKIEGMVSLRDIKEDYFEFDEKEYTVTGKRTKKIYRLGDKVRIKVLKVSLEQRLIDYTLVSEYK